jgi:hypothetical protein
MRAGGLGRLGRGFEMRVTPLPKLTQKKSPGTCPFQRGLTSGAQTTKRHTTLLSSFISKIKTLVFVFTALTNEMLSSEQTSIGFLTTPFNELSLVCQFHSVSSTQTF